MVFIIAKKYLLFVHYQQLIHTLLSTMNLSLILYVCELITDSVLKDFLYC